MTERMPPIAALDAWLVDVESGRRITREVRRAMFEGVSVAVCGDVDAARSLVLQLGQTYPYAGAHLFQVDDRGPRVNVGESWREIPDLSVRDLVLAGLRQDPDAVVVGIATAEAFPILIQALATGHPLVVGIAAASAQSALALVEGSLEQRDADSAAGFGRLTIELGHGGITATFERRDGALVQTARLEAGKYVFAQPPQIPRAAPLRPRELVRRFEGGGGAPTHAPRASFLPRTGLPAEGTTRLGARRVLLPEGARWPACRSCASPLTHLLQLDLATLPEPLARADGLAQLFVCVHGCENAKTDAPGVSCFVARAPLAEVESPVPVDRDGGGDVVGWDRRDEDPSGEDHDAPAEGRARAWHCDKLGGWPAWTQAADWPSCPECAARMELLFSLCDASDHWRAGEPRWDDDRAQVVPGTPAERIFDPERPVHFPGLFTGDAEAFLFRCGRHPERLAFLWQA